MTLTSNGEFRVERLVKCIPHNQLTDAIFLVADK